MRALICHEPQPVVYSAQEIGELIANSDCDQQAAVLQGISDMAMNMGTGHWQTQCHFIAEALKKLSPSKLHEIQQNFYILYETLGAVEQKKESNKPSVITTCGQTIQDVINEADKRNAERRKATYSEKDDVRSENIL